VIRFIKRPLEKPKPNLTIQKGAIMKKEKKQAKKNSVKNSSKTMNSSNSLNEAATNQQRFPLEEKRERHDGPGGN